MIHSTRIVACSPTRCHGSPITSACNCSSVTANRLKVLVHDGIGVWLCARRLHQGRFRWVDADVGTQMAVTLEQLQALVIGLPWQRVGEHATIRVL